MNPNLSQLQPYPFERLAKLFDGVTAPPGLQPIALSIGEPRHATPAFITEEVITHLHGLSRYPLTRGIAELREAITQWLTTRFSLPATSVDPERHVLPVNGTREALFGHEATMEEPVAAPARLTGPWTNNGGYEIRHDVIERVGPWGRIGGK